MWIRVSTSIVGGAVMTASLVYWMQLMIADSDHEVVDRQPPPFVSIFRAPPPPPPHTPRKPPERLEPLTRPPNVLSIETDLTTGPAVTDGPVTPPGLSSPPVRLGGRQGPWVEDHDYLLAARIDPTYPHIARIRELEGSVVVGFTISRQGTVTDVRIIESTHAMFERAAAAAVARSRYRPRIVDGAPVEVTGLTTRIAFRLDD